MKQGNVAFQALTIYTSTSSAAHANGKKQIDVFSNLLSKHPDKYALWDGKPPIKKNQDVPISVSLVFENAHSLCEESQKIGDGIAYLEKTLLKFKKVLYISLTWNLENRLGGGCGSKIGLKEDGKVLLEWMDKKKIAVDLSHASDFLADDILNFLEKKSLAIPVMASHSNMRAISPLERNLPDPFVKEVIRRKGLLGFNFFAPFIGSDPRQMLDHVSHLFSLGGEKNLCFGGDFFHLPGFAYLKEMYGTDIGFFPEYENSSCYPKALSFLEEELKLSKEQLEGIAFENFQNYVAKTFV
jgi:microsomal dipeptidase-like Zn-dependent dipeptidase